MAMVALTGSIIMFRYEINRLTVPGTAYVTPQAERLSLDELTGIVRASRPRDKFVQAAWEAGPGSAWNFRTQSPEGHRIHTFIDQYTGRITGQEDYQHKLLQWFYDLHATLLSGNTGRTINGFVALVTAIMAVAGLVLWWPGRGNWRFGFRYLRGARWQRQNYDLHKITGFYSSVALLFIAFTAAYFSFPDLYKRALTAVTGTTVSLDPPHAKTRWSNRQVPLEEFLSAAETSQPGAHAISFSFPQKTGEPVTVRLKENRDWHRIGLDFVYLEPSEARVIRSDRFEDQPLATKFALLMSPFHFGRFGGRLGDFGFYAVMILYTIVGCAPAALFVTGALMYWNRSLSKRRRPAPVLPRPSVRAPDLAAKG